MSKDSVKDIEYDLEALCTGSPDEILANIHEYASNCASYNGIPDEDIRLCSDLRRTIEDLLERRVNVSNEFYQDGISAMFDQIEGLELANKRLSSSSAYVHRDKNGERIVVGDTVRGPGGFLWYVEWMDKDYVYASSERNLIKSFDPEVLEWVN